MFQLNYNKARNIDLGKLKQQYCEEDQESQEAIQDHNYIPFHIQKLQNYNPIYSLFFDLNENNYNKISLNHDNHFIDLKTVFSIKTQTKEWAKVHIKYGPLLDPIHFLIGKYEKCGTQTQNLPQLTNQPDTIHPKIASITNATYVDCFFSYLSSLLLNNPKSKFIHGIDFYGSYLGIQENFRMVITDEFDYLQKSQYFLENNHITYDLELPDFIGGALLNSDNSHKNKPKLNISDEDEILSVNDIIDEDNNETEIECYSNNDDLQLVFENENRTQTSNVSTSLNGSLKSSYSSDEDSAINYSSEEEEEENNDEEESGDEDDNTEWSSIDSKEGEDEEDYEEGEIIAYLRNFPMQMICLEKCDGTMDKLLEDGLLKDEELLAALFQVIMILVTYQKAFWLTHNDLHTNNIVFKHTEMKHLKYIYEGKEYLVPTYGKIFVIIDFGRSIYKFQDKLFCSDSFQEGGDAHTQYNFEPFYNPNKPILTPNMSFDLCRLGCSLYDFVFDDQSETDIRSSKKSWTDVQKLVAKWCEDDHGKNILYKASGEERYPQFKLYKMIARIVHGCTPESQIQYSAFHKFATNIPKKNKSTTVIIDIDSIDKYYV